MKPFRILSFFLAFNLAALSCSSAGKALSEGQYPPASVTDFQPLGPAGQRHLFKAGIDVFSRHFSGLILIKPMPVKGSYRVVFLSELGLNLLDMSYQGGAFTVISVQEFLNRRSVLNTLQADFHALLLDLSTVRNPKISTKRGEGVQGGEFRFRQGLQAYCYTYDVISFTRLIRRRRCLGKSEIRVDYSTALRISIEHGGSPVQVEMIELNSPEYHPDE